jgi:hypothetical protein
MEKEFEALEFIKEKFAYLEYNCEKYNVPREELNILHNALTELQAIKEAKPSLALTILDYMGLLIVPTMDGDKSLKDFCNSGFNTLKQNLLKIQELEKENEKMKALLLELADISPDNRDCIYQCISIVNAILKANISSDTNKACKVNLEYLTDLK